MNLEVRLGNDYLNVKQTTLVSLNHYLTIYTENGGTIELKVDINTDLNNVPKEYHEVIINMLTSKYLNKVSFGDNPFSTCVPKKKRKWKFW